MNVQPEDANRIYDPATPDDLAQLRALKERTKGGRFTLAFEAARPGSYSNPQPTWRYIRGNYDELNSFPAPGFLYRKMRLERERSRTPEARSTSSTNVGENTIGAIKRTFATQADRIANSQNQLADQQNQIDSTAESLREIAVSVTMMRRALHDSTEEAAKQQKAMQDLSGKVSLILKTEKRVDDISAIVKNLQRSVESISTSSTSRAASSSVAPSVAPSKMSPLKTLQRKIGITEGSPDARPQGLSNAGAQSHTHSSLALWEQGPTRASATPSLSTASDEELTRLSMARSASANQTVWSSHDLRFDEVFEDSERSLLLDLPILYLHKQEAHFAATRRSIFYACQWILKWQSKTVQDITSEFERVLDRDSALSPDSAIRLSTALQHIESTDVPRKFRIAAWWQLAKIALRCSKTHYISVKRIEIAEVSSKPGSPEEVAAWVKGSIKVAHRAGYPVPISATGF